MKRYFACRLFFLLILHFAKLSTATYKYGIQGTIEGEQYLVDTDLSHAHIDSIARSRIPVVKSRERRETPSANIVTSTHDFYNASIYVNKEETDEIWYAIKGSVINAMLSHSYRRAKTFPLQFNFPFYGHNITNVTVATGGFLYTGEYVHSWLAATQYIAPLMANFDTNILDSSLIRVNDNRTAFTAVWENVPLQDKSDKGTFTFSATLHKSGDIVFTYFSMPMSVQAIQIVNHPVKIGLSDAYILEREVSYIKRKTIYEHHRINFNNSEIVDGTIIRLTPLPTCLEYTDCLSCLQHITKLKCAWCPALKRCSTGFERMRPEWLKEECDVKNVTTLQSCLNADKNNAGDETSFNNNVEISTEGNLVSGENNYHRNADDFTDNLKNQISNQSNNNWTANYKLNHLKSSDENKSSDEISLNTRNSTLNLSDFNSKHPNSDDVADNLKIQIRNQTNSSSQNSKISNVVSGDNIINSDSTNVNRDFYNSSIYVNKAETEKIWSTIQDGPLIAMLSHSYLKSMTVQLKFDFPFYGHNITNVTVVNGGFVYTGEYVHSSLVATQYIAPLMANFDTSILDSSLLRLHDNGTAFTAVWENVALQDKSDEGTLSFSATLHKSGEIVFTYFSIPLSIYAMQNSIHPVKVGLSDSFIVEEQDFHQLNDTTRKTIQEYDRINFNKSDISNGTIIRLTPLPTCLEYTDCLSCLQHAAKFNCAWCPVLYRCSSGIEHKRHDWLKQECDITNVTALELCPRSKKDYISLGESFKNDPEISTEGNLVSGENNQIRNADDITDNINFEVDTKKTTTDV